MNEKCRFISICDRPIALARIAEELGLEPGEKEEAQKMICNFDGDKARRVDCPAFLEYEAKEGIISSSPKRLA